MDINMQPPDRTERADITPACTCGLREDLVAGAKPAADGESMIAALHLFEPGVLFAREQPAMQEREAL
jgi:hypothetical protein